MSQPKRPYNTSAHYDDRGYPTRQWMQWLSEIWSAVVPARVFYIPTSEGVPAFTPEVRGGFVPMCYDTSNNDLYIYNAAWKKVTLA